MAAKGLLKLGNALLLTNSAYIEHSANVFRPLLCYQQTRGKRRMKPRAKNEPCPWLVKKRAPAHFNFVTEENRAFLDEAARDHYKNLPSPLRDEPWQRNEWTINTRRTGVLGVKIGVIPQWKKDGTRFLCQLIQIVDNHVIRYSSPEEFQKSVGFLPGYSKDIGAVVVGALSDSPWNYSKAYHNLFTEAGVPPKRKLTRFFVTPDAAIQPGTPLSAMHFKVGDYVDCSAKTINHGFQGVMKRFGFAGGPSTHGNTKFHRRPGSLSTGKQRGMFKGTKMPGIMGGDWRITKGIKIWRINTKYNILYTSTGVPGPNHCYVRIYDTANFNRKEEMVKNCRRVSMPTFYPDDVEEELPEDIFHEDLFQMNDNTITFKDDDES
ncbi:39S ribosomal protein L3, mitochondrial-like [Mercenaria mercenaria]|uniref:39S ribosomal protein L3, mitochondrial-like n=1 Tax=Mercenaria mercenaria TaxID=6596 RepID=UPI00234F0DE0|nr:39S ribosomal protein L3, mitochondrial-like [Mercenaria mercenaria]